MSANTARMASSGRSANSEEAMDRLWQSIQALLIACANIRKLLWAFDSPQFRRKCGINVEMDDRIRARIREALKQDAGSPLFSGKLRNHFEHFDERIARWGSTSTRMIMADQCVGVAIRGIDP